MHFFEGEREFAGWALNLSRGGLRAILEDKVELGAEFDISLGDDQVRRPGRIVWIQDEPDGSIVGVSFLDDPASTSVALCLPARPAAAAVNDQGSYESRSRLHEERDRVGASAGRTAGDDRGASPTHLDENAPGLPPVRPEPPSER